MVVMYNGAKKPQDFKTRAIITPINTINDGTGWFQCNSKKYEIFVPENAKCEICTFEWRYKPVKAIEHNSICVDTWANQIWEEDHNTKLPRTMMRFTQQSDAQNFLDNLEGKRTFGEGVGEWVMMISSLVLSFIVLISCCVFCGKRRVSFLHILDLNEFNLKIGVAL